MYGGWDIYNFTRVFITLLFLQHGYDPLVEEKEEGTISFKTYFNLFRAGGSYLVLAIVSIVFVVAEVRCQKIIALCILLHFCYGVIILLGWTCHDRLVVVCVVR